ncbi:MAG: hypothetical protein RL329_1287 [Bacteroidota bacterium]
MLSVEEPLLLHPALDQPDDYLIFEKNGCVMPKNKEEKGLVSIEIYGLNKWQERPNLIRDRKQIVDEVKELVHEAVRKYVNDDRLYEDLSAKNYLFQQFDGLV